MRIPTATYRLQFHQNFNFQAAKTIVPYLVDLGITDLYASPIFKARKGSMHGYDVVDPMQLNPELGTQEDFDALIAELQRHDMGWVQDIVPNHMAYDSQNHFLMDILENGTDSEYIDFFDIAWNQPYENIRGRVLAPLLGDFYNECLNRGEIQLSYEEAGLSVNYYSLKLPVKIESYTQFLIHNLGKLARIIGRRHPDFVKLLGILYLTKNIPGETKSKEREDQITFVKELLWEVYNQNEEVKKFIDSNITDFNGEAHSPESFNLLDSLLLEQFYRLAFWKVGAEEINYRRFFTVNELISVKVEELRVFNKTHALISQLVEEGKFTGLRIDHIDGLYHPTQYLQRLREKVGDTYITVEKILEIKEDLPEFWDVQGTSGYDFLNYVNGVFCQLNNEEKFDGIYQRFTGLRTPYEQLFIEKKALIVDKNLAGDAENLAQLLRQISSQTREGRDFTQYGLKRALIEILILFPVYRTYISPEELAPNDIDCIREVIAQAREREPLLVKELSYIEKLLTLECEEYLDEEQSKQQLFFVMRLQQMTGPLMAKGIEDTLFYVYNRLISLNEVGGNPGQLGTSLAIFNEFNTNRSERWPQAMSATATHDTKRGEDVRARINVLSEIPEEWEQQVTQWQEINQDKRQRSGKKSVPSANDEYFFYQTLVGAYPYEDAEYSQFVDRVKDYLIKAVREAKVKTAWLRPDAAYEEGFLQFAEAVLNQEQSSRFMEVFLPFQQRIAHYGVLNSLAQVLLKYTTPGVPDLYQGTELWDLSLVDPDNRRPVDYERRNADLTELKTKIQTDILALIEEMLAAAKDGKVKLFLTYQVLQARKAYLKIFQQGDYQPLEVVGQFNEQVIAFARSFENQTAIAIAPRFLTQLIQPGELPLGKVWQDTQIKLPSSSFSSWHNVITNQAIGGNESLAVGDTLSHFPVALLIGQQ